MAGGKTRFTIDPPAVLRDREGRILGEMSAVTIDLAEGVELAPAAPAAENLGGDYRGGEESSLKTETSPLAVSSPENASSHGGVGETRRRRILTSIPVGPVWQHYLDLMKPRRAEISPEESRIICEALKVASVDECKNAITACYQSDWHMKRDPRAKKKANTLSHILKKRQASRTSIAQTTRERIDWWLDRYEAGSLLVTDSEEISGLKRNVRRGQDDSLAQRSEAELKTKYGIIVEWEEQPTPVGFKLMPTFKSSGGVK